MAARSRRANTNAGKLLDANVRTNAARSKLPLEITEEDPFSTGIKLSSDIQNKKDLSGKTRNDDLGSVKIQRVGHRRSTQQSVANQKQQLREDRRRARDLKNGKIISKEVEKAEAEQKREFLKVDTRNNSTFLLMFLMILLKSKSKRKIFRIINRQSV